MKATLNIPDTLINDLIMETGEKNKSRLIETALEEMLIAIRRKKQISQKGKSDLDSTTTDTQEKKSRWAHAAERLKSEGFLKGQGEEVKELTGNFREDFNLE